MLVKRVHARRLHKRRHWLSAALTFGLLSLGPAAASAHYPYDSPPPGWWTENTDSSCQATESFHQGSSQPGGSFDEYSIDWTSPGRTHCFKDVPDPDPAVGFRCEGDAHHTHYSNGTSYYSAVWICAVGPGDRRDAYCLRYDFDVTGPCDPADYTQEPNAQGGDACQQAKQRVRKLKQKVQSTDGAKKKSLKKKLQKAKQEKQEACG